MQWLNKTLVTVGLLACCATSTAWAEDHLDIGGAVRYNYGWRDYTPNDRSTFALELVRVDINCRKGRLICSIQHRWYDGFNAPHHAWFGIQAGEQDRIIAGVVQAPFGLLPYASHSFWFGSGYYLGIEDDYDLGVSWTREWEGWRFDAAWMAADEFGTGRIDGRYSFDVATTAELPYRERGRALLRAERTMEADEWTLKLGGSVSSGRIERRPDGERYSHDAVALHAEARRGPLELEMQWARYDYDVPDQRVALTGFLFPFEIASAADVVSANVAWTFDELPFFDSITCYNDHSRTHASGAGLGYSVQNVTGCSFAKGVMYTYVDWIAGRNMWFAGGPGIALGGADSDRWRSRLNVNVGFYF